MVYTYGVYIFGLRHSNYMKINDVNALIESMPELRDHELDWLPHFLVTGRCRIEGGRPAGPAQHWFKATVGLSARPQLLPRRALQRLHRLLLPGECRAIDEWLGRDGEARRATAVADQDRENLRSALAICAGLAPQRSASINWLTVESAGRVLEHCGNDADCLIDSKIRRETLSSALIDLGQTALCCDQPPTTNRCRFCWRPAVLGYRYCRSHKTGTPGYNRGCRVWKRKDLYSQYTRSIKERRRSVAAELGAMQRVPGGIEYLEWAPAMVAVNEWSYEHDVMLTQLVRFAPLVHQYVGLPEEELLAEKILGALDISEREVCEDYLMQHFGGFWPLIDFAEGILMIEQYLDTRRCISGRAAPGKCHITQERIKDCCEFMQRGVSRADVLSMLGIHRSTFWRRFRNRY